MNTIDTPQENKQTWLAKAVDAVFFWNTIGNFLGWGSLLLCRQLGVWTILCLIHVLPIAVPLILLLNLIVGLMLLSAKIRQGITPKFNKPPIYFVIGVISSILFFIGSAIFLYFYCQYTLFTPASSVID